MRFPDAGRIVRASRMRAPPGAAQSSGAAAVAQRKPPRQSFHTTRWP